MEKEKIDRSSEELDGEAPSSPSSGKNPWQKPKLAFVEPKLTKHGELEKVTSGFFCPFEP
jgi:hypothetical protein